MNSVKNFINLDAREVIAEHSPAFHAQEAVGTKTAAEIEADFLRTYAESQPHGRPEGGLTIEEMAKAANVGHASIRRWLAGQSGYKAILGTKQYATRKQVVTYYVKQ